LERLTAWLDRVALAADTDELPEGGEITMMTVHSAKGLEYPVVFVVQMNEGQFPHARSEETGIDEERRLAYVAFTRAMKRLIVTRSRQAPSYEAAGRGGAFAQPSRFLLGIPSEVCEGDLPSAEPALQPSFSPDVHKDKLRTFLRRRLGQESAEDPDEAPSWLRPSRPVSPPAAPRAAAASSTWIEVSDPRQLVKGTRIHHGTHGLGVVKHTHQGRLQVAFDEGPVRWVPLSGADLHLVLDDGDPADG
jgi:hypothetical protein